MTSLTPEKLERMNQLFLQEEFENAKEKAQAFVYETEEEYDARINKTIAEMEKEFEEELEKKKENLSESELKLLQGYGDVEY
jgi:rRNA maturation endonuclease Nob1